MKIRPNGARSAGSPGATYPFPAAFSVVRDEAWAATSKLHGAAIHTSAWAGVSLRLPILGFAMALALTAGWTDWRSRRIPNWLTMPALLVGIVVNVLASGLAGMKTSLLGAGFGLLVLLPFVLLRSLGAGDWKLAAALGAFVGWEVLLNLLIGSIFVAGMMALGLVIYKRRFIRTMRNIWGLLGSLLLFRMPGTEVSLDNPQSLKVPYGVALALTTLVFGIGKMWGARY